MSRSIRPLMILCSLIIITAFTSGCTNDLGGMVKRNVEKTGNFVREHAGNAKDALGAIGQDDLVAKIEQAESAQALADQSITTAEAAKSGDIGTIAQVSVDAASGNLNSPGADARRYFLRRLKYHLDQGMEADTAQIKAAGDASEYVYANYEGAEAIEALSALANR